MLVPLVYFLTRHVAIALWAGLFLLLVGHHFGQPTPLARGTAFFLNLRLWQWLGMVSYSLYIVHWPGLVLVRFGVERMFPQSGPIPQAVLLGVTGWRWPAVSRGSCIGGWKNRAWITRAISRGAGVRRTMFR